MSLFPLRIEPILIVVTWSHCQPFFLMGAVGFMMLVRFVMVAGTQKLHAVFEDFRRAVLVAGWEGNRPIPIFKYIVAVACVIIFFVKIW